MERDPLYGLEEKAKAFSEAISKMEERAQNLNTSYPKNQDLTNLNFQEKLSRIRQIGERRAVIRQAINEKAIPFLRAKQEELEAQILRSESIRADMASIRDLYVEGSLTEEEYNEALTIAVGLVDFGDTKSTTFNTPAPVLQSVEAKTQEELLSYQPEVILYREERLVGIRGETIYISDDAQWAALLALMDRGSEGMSTQEVLEVMQKAGSKSQFSSGAIGPLRLAIEEKPSEPKIIVSDKKGSSKSRYTFMGKLIEEKIEPVVGPEDIMRANLAEIERLSEAGILQRRSLLIRVVEEASKLGIGAEIKIPEMKAEEVEFTKVDEIILAELIYTRTKNRDVDRTPRKFVVDGKSFGLLLRDEEEEAMRRLMDDVDTEVEDVQKAREEVLTKIETLFRDKKADDLVLKFKGDLGHLLIFLFAIDRKIKPSYLFEFLRSGLDPRNFSNDVYQWIRRLILLENIGTTSMKVEASEPQEKVTSLPDGQSIIDIKGRPGDVLQIILIAKTDQERTIPYLCKKIWPGMDASNARDNLSVALSVLRKKLVFKHWSIPKNIYSKEETIYRLEKIVEAGEEQIVESDEVDITTEGIDTTKKVVGEQAATEQVAPAEEVTEVEVPINIDPAVQAEVDRIIAQEEARAAAPARVKEGNDKLLIIEAAIEKIVTDAGFETWPETMGTKSLSEKISERLHKHVSERTIRVYIEKHFIHPAGIVRAPELSRVDAIIAYYLNSLGNKINNLSDVERNNIPIIAQSKYKAWKEAREEQKG